MVIQELPRSTPQEWLAAHAGADIDLLSGTDFERCLEVLFDRLGYAVEPTSHYAHADLIVSRNGVRTAVEAKRQAHVVGDHAVQQVASARPFYQCDEALVITNSEFQPRARKLALANKVELWDRLKLAEMLHQAGILRPGGPLPAPFCARCGVQRIWRDCDSGPFWGCPNYGRTRCRGAPLRQRLTIDAPPAAIPAPAGLALQEPVSPATWRAALAAPYRHLRRIRSWK